MQNQKQTRNIHLFTIPKRRPSALNTFASTAIRLKCHKKYVLPFKQIEINLITSSTTTTSTNTNSSPPHPPFILSLNSKTTLPYDQKCTPEHSISINGMEHSTKTSLSLPPPSPPHKL